MDFKSPQFNTVVEQALVLAVGNERWERAIQRAASELIAGTMIVSELASGAIVTTDNGSYKITHECECSAAKHGHRQCKHRAGRRLCALYTEALVADMSEHGRIETRVETTIECDRTGVKYKVVRCDGWHI